MAVTRVLVLGGYGNFGKRIIENLATIADIAIIIAGRNANKAETFRQQLLSQGARAELLVATIDMHSPEFTQTLKALSPDLVIHTGGPFQGQSYQVPAACIEVGSHYIDLADDRRFVCDIRSLHEQAAQNNVLVVSGASSVPGLSSTVIDHLAHQFETLKSIDFAIAPGNQAERGEATVKAILSYTGRPFKVFNNGRWSDQYGWMSPRKVHFGEVVGKRWLANIDIPDLELFPQRYPSVNTVRFQAGLELAFLHLGMVAMAMLAKIGLIKDWSVYTHPIFRCSKWFERLGTDTGAMQIQLSGQGKNNQPKRIKWTLCAENGVGPYIPTIAAIILAKKLINSSPTTRGAQPCLGMFTLDEFDHEISQLDIYHTTEVDHG